MSITERQRAELYKALEEKIGALRTDFETLRADVERSMREQTRTMLSGLAGIDFTFLGAALAGARLLGA